MARTEFPQRARRDDPNGHMTVQRNQEFLRDELDKFKAKVVRGATTVAQGATTVVATHNLNSATYSVGAVPGVNPGGNWWISNKTATQFQFNLAAAAPVGGVPFDWIVIGG